MHLLKGKTDKQIRGNMKAHKALEAKMDKKMDNMKATLTWETAQGLDKIQYLRRRSSGISPVTQEFRDGYANITWN